jgi:hypothetical protein
MKQNVFMNLVFFLRETERICELRIILCMKRNVIMNFVSFFLRETERICELCIILCMKRNVFMNFVSFFCVK